MARLGVALTVTLDQAPLSILNEFLELVALQEIPEVQVSSSAAVVVQEQVIVQPLPEARVSRQRVQHRTVEQVVDPRVPPALSGIVEQMVDVPVPGRTSSVASERIVEQVVDVPDSRGALLPRANQQITGSSAAAPETSNEPFQRFFFALFPEGKKWESWATVECETGVALELVHAGALWR